MAPVIKGCEPIKARSGPAQPPARMTPLTDRQIGGLDDWGQNATAPRRNRHSAFRANSEDGMNEMNAGLSMRCCT